eukprot:4444101-Amphidinium_carterae.1
MTKRGYEHLPRPVSAKAKAPLAAGLTDEPIASFTEEEGEGGGLRTAMVPSGGSGITMLDRFREIRGSGGAVRPGPSASVGR